MDSRFKNLTPTEVAVLIKALKQLRTDGANMDAYNMQKELEEL